MASKKRSEQVFDSKVTAQEKRYGDPSGCVAIARELGCTKQNVQNAEASGIRWLKYCIRVKALAEEAGLTEDVAWLNSIGVPDKDWLEAFDALVKE